MAERDSNDNKGKMIGVRVTEEQADRFSRAAKSEGKKVSEWLRDLGLSATSIPTATIPESVITTQERRQEQRVVTNYNPLVLEHAARAEAPIGKSVTEFLMSVGSTTIQSAQQISEQPVKSWLPVLMKIKQEFEFDPGSAAENLQSLLRGTSINIAKFPRWHSDKRVLYALAAELDKQERYEE